MMKMLSDARICADVPTADLKRARRFYEETLGLKAGRSDDERGVYYQAGDGMLNLYVRPHATAEYTVATFWSRASIKSCPACAAGELSSRNTTRRT